MVVRSMSSDSPSGSVCLCARVWRQVAARQSAPRPCHRAGKAGTSDLLGSSAGETSCAYRHSGRGILIVCIGGAQQSHEVLLAHLPHTNGSACAKCGHGMVQIAQIRPSYQLTRGYARAINSPEGIATLSTHPGVRPSYQLTRGYDRAINSPGGTPELSTHPGVLPRYQLTLGGMVTQNLASAARSSRTDMSSTSSRAGPPPFFFLFFLFFFLLFRHVPGFEGALTCSSSASNVSMASNLECKSPPSGSTARLACTHTTHAQGAGHSSLVLDCAAMLLELLFRLQRVGK